MASSEEGESLLAPRMASDGGIIRWLVQDASHVRAYLGGDDALFRTRMPHFAMSHR